jgi:hypothetical protein
MSLNITGITINNNFGKDPEKVMRLIRMPVTYEREIDFRSVSEHKEAKYFDIFFSDEGTTIYCFEPFILEPKLSENLSILYYTISEPSVLFSLAFDENGNRIREVMEYEGQVEINKGSKLEVENGERLKEAIIRQNEKMFGQSFYPMPLETSGYRYKLANVSEKDIYKAPFYDTNTLASNPGRLSLNFLQWIKMNFLSVSRKIILLMLVFLLMIKVHWLFGIVFIGLVLHNAWYWFMVYNKFKGGDVNPGKVISVDPDLVAVATNMSKSMGNYPILKIVKTTLTKHEKEKGVFIPTIALYKDNPYMYPFWAEFHPVPISHGTTDKAVLKARFETFTSEEFKRIEAYLKEVNSLKEGTYKVETTTSGWKNYPEVEIGTIGKMKSPSKPNKPLHKP